MHFTSFEKMRSIRDTYVPSGAKVLDVGSATFGGPTYRDLFGRGYEYVGLDIEDGNNVDLAVKDAYQWVELDDDSFDVAISGQAFEHNPFFWITAAEMARVVRPGGIIAIIAPARGHVHRYPVDCWRFFPDSWVALADYIGLELEETYLEPAGSRVKVGGVLWGDSVLVARKPRFAGDDERDAFHARLAAIRATATATFPDDVVLAVGPAMSDYRDRLTVDGLAWRRVQLINLAKTCARLAKNRGKKLLKLPEDRFERRVDV